MRRKCFDLTSLAQSSNGIKITLAIVKTWGVLYPSRRQALKMLHRNGNKMYTGIRSSAGIIPISPGNINVANIREIQTLYLRKM